MDPEQALPDGGVNNFEFAFNCADFSDRVLRIEVMVETSKAEAGQRKPFSEGKGTDSETNYSKSLDSHILRVESIYISSLVLAAKSPFFNKLFSNGMRESKERHVTLRIHASEEAALMELLSFMYTGKVSTTSPAFLLDILMAADKFEVISCVRHCSQLLSSLPMTTESAILYLDLPNNISIPVAAEFLIDAAKKHITNSFKDIMKFQDEIMNLPLLGIKTLLTSNDLQVDCENEIYDLVLMWARTHYPSLEERREILSSHLIQHIRFAHMNCWELREVLACNDLDHELSSKLVIEALFFKTEAAQRQRYLSTERSSDKRYMERAYHHRPLKVIQFVTPHRHCIVYLDLKKEECAKLYPSDELYSQAFDLGGQEFFLSACCNLDELGSPCFGLYLWMLEKDSTSFIVDYKFAARTKPSGHFVTKSRYVYTYTGGTARGWGSRNLFDMPWTSFMADDCPFFIGGTLHLRAELNIADNNQNSEENNNNNSTHNNNNQNSEDCNKCILVLFIFIFLFFLFFLFMNKM